MLLPVALYILSPIKANSALLRGHLEREYLETEKVIVLRNTIINCRFASFSPLFSGFGNLGS